MIKKIFITIIILHVVNQAIGSDETYNPDMPKEVLKMPSTEQNDEPNSTSKQSLIKKQIAIFEQREKELSKRANELSKREANIIEKEIKLNQREQYLIEREKFLNQMKIKLFNQSNEANAQTNSENNSRQSNSSSSKTIIQNRDEFKKAPSIVGKYAIAIDAISGEILDYKKANIKTAVASTQKLMTALLIYESGNLDKKITIEKKDVMVQPSKIGIKPGEKYTRQELLQALLVKSGNDVAKCLARDNAGSVAEFVKKMNTRARSLGMQDTNFLNPHGLTQTGQYSTARDISILALTFYKIPLIRQIVKTKNLEFRLADGKVKLLKSTNKLLNSEPKCTGMKTGYTRASGFCLVSSGKSGNKERIVVVLGSTSSWIWKDSKVLLNWALRN